jgi:hypothetical protein
VKELIVYDVEVAISPDDVQGGWDNPQGMGFASGVAYFYNRNQYFLFLHEKGRQELISLLLNQIAITFNGIKFDSRVILGNERGLGYASGAVVSSTAFPIGWYNYDLLLEYVKSRFACHTVAEAELKLGAKEIHDGSFGLDGLAEGTLGMGKIGHGAKAPLLYQEKRYDELLQYNLHDVRLTKALFDFSQKYGFLVDKAGRVVKIQKYRPL